MHREGWKRGMDVHRVERVEEVCCCENAYSCSSKQTNKQKTNKIGALVIANFSNSLARTNLSLPVLAEHRCQNPLHFLYHILIRHEKVRSQGHHDGLQTRDFRRHARVLKERLGGCIGKVDHTVCIPATLQCAGCHCCHGGGCRWVPKRRLLLLLLWVVGLLSILHLWRLLLLLMGVMLLILLRLPAVIRIAAASIVSGLLWLLVRVALLLLIGLTSVVSISSSRSSAILVAAVGAVVRHDFL
jgi:hypothetical protein